MTLKLKALLGVAAFTLFSDISNAGEKQAVDAKAQTKPEGNSASGEIPLPQELQPVDVKASEEELKKFAALLENFMKSEKGLELMQKVQLRAQYTEAKNENETRKLLDANKDALVSSEKAIVLGNQKGTVTLVLVADPLCPNCRILESMLKKVIKQNPSLRIIMHQWAFVNPQESARIASYLNAAYTINPQAFGKLHEAFLALKEIPNEAAMNGLLAGAKYDPTQVKAKAESPAEGQKQIEDMRALAKELKLPGAPILMALDPEGKLMLVPPLSEQDLSKLVGDLTQAIKNGGSSAKPASSSAP